MVILSLIWVHFSDEKHSTVLYSTSQDCMTIISDEDGMFYWVDKTLLRSLNSISKKNPLNSTSLRLLP